MLLLFADRGKRNVLDGYPALVLITRMGNEPFELVPMLPDEHT